MKLEIHKLIKKILIFVIINYRNGLMNGNLVTNRKVEVSNETDQDGWQYGFDFKSTTHKN